MHKLLKIPADVYRYVLLSRFAGHKLRALADCFDDDIERLVGLASSFEYRHPLFPRVTIMPSQVKEEIYELRKLVHEIKPKVVLEIGTSNGGTLFLFCRVADPKATIISVDLPSGPFGGGYPMWKIPLYKSFARNGKRIYLVRADSHDPAILQEIKKILNDEKVGFLFIDGDHRYEGVKKDFKMYRTLVVKGGIVAFHDIVPGSPKNVGGVPGFWDEVKQNFRYVECVKNWNQGGYGIGVIYV